ncbi:MAG: SIS domain-containing protein, partial [Pseudomonadales bacterium]|nr:SIS domain-containing protein [Pseudomonadales bacterium]
GYLLAAAIADRFDEAKAELDQLSISLTHYLVPETLATVEDVAARIASAGHLFVLGRSAHFGSALVGALNIKEASYIHAEAFSAGELKHGVIALIEPGVPVLVFRAAGDDYMLNVASEVRARGAFVIGLSGEANPLFDARLPMPPTVGDADIISSIIPCQLLAYALGVRRGVNPDKPRNLAKSVTVQ